jgi:hypothetical protein
LTFIDYLQPEDLHQRTMEGIELAFPALENEPGHTAIPKGKPMRAFLNRVTSGQ